MRIPPHEPLLRCAPVFESLLARGGYLFVFGGALVEGEAVLLAAGAMAHKGLLKLPLVMLAALLGGLANDVLWFALGKRYGRAFIHRRPRLAVRAAQVEGWSRRHGLWFVLAFRFLYGLRTIAPAVLGAIGYPAARFLALDLLGASLWAAAVGGAGYGVGAALAGLFGRASRLEEALLVGVALASLSWLVVRRHASRPRAP